MFCDGLASEDNKLLNAGKSVKGWPSSQTVMRPQCVEPRKRCPLCLFTLCVGTILSAAIVKEEKMHL